MAKRKPEIRMLSFGIYTPFDRDGKTLPRLKQRATKVPVELGVEFGYVLEIKKGKGCKIDFEIDHPPFKNDAGEIAPPFVGHMYVKTNDYKIFLGDTVWEPIDDKVGPWKITAWIDGKMIAEKTIEITGDIT